jgi:hypothetical protein
MGERFRIGIDESVRLYDKLLLVLSKGSVESQWVEKEKGVSGIGRRRRKGLA